MTALNKQALRETAEKAQEHGVFNMDIHSQTVLALLDELEAARNGKDELQQGFIANQEEAHEAIKYATELKEQLARACTGREEAFREVDEIQKSLDHTHRRRAIWRGRAEDAEAKLEAAEKRIAELEANKGKPVMFIDGDISASDAEKLAEVIREMGRRTSACITGGNGSREVAVKQFDDFQIVHYGATEDYAKGYIDCQNNYNKALAAAGIGVKGE
ncbi:hypothetical protein OA819_04390 [Citrobacter freundii]|uniref:hypothetical protein n=1 Tax=Citrobacter freundii TaxID=546 RepID=UPI0025CAE1F7|nr:hypothetical protein [Citrobacter freundii]MDN4237946.1 hypothetical protein [Citrobacter freundii]MDN4316915.1 hypothetical protein [Citrobacter freundii]